MKDLLELVPEHSTFTYILLAFIGGDFVLKLIGKQPIFLCYFGKFLEDSHRVFRLAAILIFVYMTYKFILCIKGKQYF